MTGAGPVRVAAVQAAPVFLDRDATVEKAVTSIEEAAGAGARLVVFPETWIPQIHVAAWPEVGDPELHRFATFEGRCFAICVMGASLTPDSIPPDFELPEALSAASDFTEAAGEEVLGTCVFGPDGTCLAAARAGEETIVYADLDLDRIGEEQQALDVAGHYNRPDVFELRVDETPKPPVSWDRRPAAEGAVPESAAAR